MIVFTMPPIPINQKGIGALDRAQLIPTLPDYKPCSIKVNEKNRVA
jgi:hypothetical protein